METSLLMGASFLSGGLVMTLLLHFLVFKPMMIIVKTRGAMLDKAMQGWEETIEILKEVDIKLEIAKQANGSMVSPLQIKRD